MLYLAIFFFFGIHFVNIGLSGIQIGSIFALGTVVGIITILPSGFSNDTFKSKNLIAVGLLLSAIQYIGLSQTHEYFLILITYFIGKIGFTIYNTSMESLFYKTTNNEHIPKKIALFQGLEHLGIGLGIIASGFFLQKNIPFETISLAIGIIFVLMSAICYVLLPLNKTTPFKILHYKKDLFRPKVLYFLAIVFLFAIHFGAENTSYGLFLKNKLGLDPFSIGLYMGISITIMGATAFLIAKFLRILKAKNVLLAGLLLSGIGHILMTSQNIAFSFVFRIIHEIGDAAWFFFLYYGITKLFDLKRIGGNASIFIFASTVGTTTGALICGPLGENYGYEIPLIFSGIVTLIAYLFSIKFIHHFDHN